MKTKILSAVALLAVLCASGQTMNVHFKNGTKVEFSSDIVSYVDFTEKAPEPTVTSGDYVDLGLSVKWATCNLGATTPTGYGDYYSWGETSTKSSYSGSNYAYYNTSTATYTSIGEDISRTSYDAATANLGQDWRMPTKAELSELIDKCTLEWVQIDGVNGYKVTGTNGNSIFLPAASGTDCMYLSSTEYNNSHAWYAWLRSMGWKSVTAYDKEHGYSIRPVYDPISADGIENIIEYVKIERTGSSSATINGQGKFSVSFKITNSSSETVHLSTLGGVDISHDLGGGESYSVSLQSSSQTLQTQKQKLVFTYNGKSYTIEG
jgi:hypothetical protein